MSWEICWEIPEVTWKSAWKTDFVVQAAMDEEAEQPEQDQQPAASSSGGPPQKKAKQQACWTPRTDSRVFEQGEEAFQ